MNFYPWKSKITIQKKLSKESFNQLPKKASTDIIIWWLFIDKFEITQTTGSTFSPANISYNVRPAFWICIFTGMQTLN